MVFEYYDDILFNLYIAAILYLFVQVDALIIDDFGVMVLWRSSRTGKEKGNNHYAIAQ